MTTNNNTSLAHVTPADAEYVDYGAAEGGPPEHAAAPVNPLVRVHALLRGRYHWAVLLGLVLAAGGAFGGYKVTKPTYQSSGLIRIKPSLPRVLVQTENSTVMPMYEGFLQSQVSLMQGERIINMAMQNPEWRALNRGMTPAAFAAFSKNLEVTHPKASELLVVSYTDPDPDASMRAVRAVTAAYEVVYKEMDYEGRNRQVLEDLKQTLAANLAAKESAIAAAAPLGATVLEKMCEQKFTELGDLESKIRDVMVAIDAAPPQAAAIAQAPAAAGAATQPSTQPAQIQELSADEIARSDRHMAELVGQLREQERNVERLMRRLGDSHPNMVDAKATLADARKDVEDYRQLVNRLVAQGNAAANVRASAAAVGGHAVAAVTGHEDLRTLQARRQALVEMRDKTQQAHQQLATKLTQVRRQTSEADGIRKDLEEVKARIQALEAESIFGRLDVLSRGDRPVAPAKDRRLALAGGGGVGGFAAGVGVFLLAGLLDRRMKHTDDARLALRQGGTKLLGILPHLPEDLSDPQELALAAHCVHHIRAMLQIHQDAVGHRVLGVTSPSAGDGKTTLVLALGLSFAASRSRTLVIDFDIVGGGITARTNAIIRRRLGQVLLRQGVVRPEQLERALAAARDSGRRLGDVLVDLGYATAADVERAAVAQGEARLGLLEALGGDPLADCVAPTGVPDLWILPLGEAGARHVPQLSPANIGRIVQQAREQFDTVLIDTGPILGSLEASLVASQVDRVALVVSRGEQRPLAERAIEMLAGSGSEVAGIVFNRAGVEEVLSSAVSSSTGASVGGNGVGRGGYRGSVPVGSQNRRFGPLATAVASSTEDGRTAGAVTDDARVAPGGEFRV